MKRLPLILISLLLILPALAQKNGVSIAPKVYDFGEVNGWNNPPATFSVTNKSGKKMLFLPTYPTDEILVELPEGAVAPGETVEVKVYYYTPNTGSFSHKKEVYVSTSGQPITFKVKGDILSISPEADLACPGMKPKDPVEATAYEQQFVVNNAKTGEPLPEATFKIESPLFKEKVKTPADGEFRLVMPLGQYSIAVNKDKFKPHSSDRYLNRNTGTVVIALWPTEEPVKEPEEIAEYEQQFIVTNARTGKPLPGASFRIGSAGLEKKVTTPSDGEFKLVLPVDQYTIAVDKEQFKPHSSDRYLDRRSGTVVIGLWPEGEPVVAATEPPEKDDTPEPPVTETVKQDEDQPEEEVAQADTPEPDMETTPAEEEEEGGIGFTWMEDDKPEEGFGRKEEDEPTEKEADDPPGDEEEEYMVFEGELPNEDEVAKEVLKDDTPKANDKAEKGDPAPDLEGGELSKARYKPNNVVFLIDVSGSMEDNHKLPLLKASMKLLLGVLRDIDYLTLVTYSSDAQVVVPTSAADNKQTIGTAIDTLKAGGWTWGVKGLEEAYASAEASFIQGGNNQVILATDGKFNHPNFDKRGLFNMIQDFNRKGIKLTVIGYGEDDDAAKLMKRIANMGAGNYIQMSNNAQDNTVLIEEIKQNSLVVE